MPQQAADRAGAAREAAAGVEGANPKTRMLEKLSSLQIAVSRRMQQVRIYSGHLTLEFMLDGRQRSFP